MPGIFEGTVIASWSEDDGYSRVVILAAERDKGLDPRQPSGQSHAWLNTQVMVVSLYVNTPRQMNAKLSPVSRVSSQELADFVAGRQTSKDIQDRIDHREQRHEPKEFPV